MNNKFFGALIALVLIGTIGLVSIKKSNNGGNSEHSNLATSHIFGNKESKVTLIEYGDFQCIACLRYYPTIEKIKEQYKDKIAFQFINFPITQIHKNTMFAHRAAEAAADQGKFWQMYNLLYENQQSWEQSLNPTAMMDSYAQTLKLDMHDFKKDMVSTTVLERINADTAKGKKIGVNGTPTFVLNGKIIKSPEPTFEAFSKILNQKLQEVNN